MDLTCFADASVVVEMFYVSGLVLLMAYLHTFLIIATVLVGTLIVRRLFGRSDSPVISSPRTIARWVAAGAVGLPFVIATWHEASLWVDARPYSLLILLCAATLVVTVPFLLVLAEPPRELIWATAGATGLTAFSVTLIALTSCHLTGGAL